MYGQIEMCFSSMNMVDFIIWLQTNKMMSIMPLTAGGCLGREARRERPRDSKAETRTAAAEKFNRGEDYY